MLKIGDFSRLCFTSVRMLRYYDENDILKPSYVDDLTGYRFYDNLQLYQAFQINYLKELGFSLSMIKVILLNYHNENELRSFLHMRKLELREEREHIDEMLLRLEKAENMLDKEKLFMKYQVELKEIQGMDVISKRGLIPSYDKEDLLWKGLYSELQERNIKVSFSNNPARAYFHDEGFKEKDVDVEICVGVTSSFEDSDNIKLRHLSNQTCASVMYVGDYSQITEISVCIGAWISEQGYELDGPNFCIYHKGYGSCDNPAEFVSEVCFPVKK